MPIFEYYCPDCQAKFELLSPFTKADDGVVCQKCQSGRVRRLISMFSARRGGDGEFNDGYHWAEADQAGGCGCGGSCSCGGH